MSTETPYPCIVAGFDGSAASRAALSLAVARARPDGRVVVVHAFGSPHGRYDGVSYQRQLDAALGRARTLLAQLPEEVPGLASIDWATELLAGPPAKAIADVADVEHASEILIGTRGLGHARALLGSVAHGLIHRARCPVTVVPERALPLTAAVPLGAVGDDTG
jgi:nucleotide-binding universal stress UspA family protein